MSIPHSTGTDAWFPCVPFDDAFYDAAPVRYRYTQDLRISPTELFEVFEDPASWPWWAPGIGHVAWTSPRPFGVGTTRTVTFWGGIQVFEVFQTWEPPRAMAFHLVGHTQQELWSQFGERYRVTDLGGGWSRLEWTVAYVPAGGFGRAHPWVQPLMWVALRSYMLLLSLYVRRVRR